MEPRERIDYLSRELLRHQRLYYVAARPEISDSEYDRLFDELQRLEAAHPELAHPNSPTRRVGSDLDSAFPEREHTLPVLSLDKVYTTEEAVAWMRKVAAAAGPETAFTAGEKIDGASIVLYYEGGELRAALTRGNGFVGNDVVESVRTIRQVPLRIEEDEPLAVRGEVYLGFADFERLNTGSEVPYANPRNLAAGTLRNLRSSLVAKVPLQIQVYEGLFSAAPGLDHLEALQRLRDLGFRTGSGIGFFCDDPGQRDSWAKKFSGLAAGELEAFSRYASEMAAARPNLDYAIDGLVLKVNRSSLRDELGYTAHHPRWAMAFKFDAPQAVTRLRGVTIQVGRNGRVTPVAELEPVRLSGSLISRATLHNQDYIDLLELGIGDEVAISKRGDVIPAVEKVTDKSPERTQAFRIPKECPFCRTSFIRVGAHLFCPNENCPERGKRLLVHFAGKGQMDIETLGEKTISFLYARGFVREIPDLYLFDYDRLLGEEGYGEKKVANIKRSLEKSKRKPFATVLASLGLEGIGPKAAEALIGSGFSSMETILEAAGRSDPEVFSAVEGIGPVTSALLVRHFGDARLLAVIEKLRGIGLQLAQKGSPLRRAKSGPLAGQAWVITGSFERFQPREAAAVEIRKRGGRVISAVTAKATHLLAGSSPGSKLAKARSLGIAIVSEKEFVEILKNS